MNDSLGSNLRTILASLPLPCNIPPQCLSRRNWGGTDPDAADNLLGLSVRIPQHLTHERHLFPLRTACTRSTFPCGQPGR